MIKNKTNILTWLIIIATAVAITFGFMYSNLNKDFKSFKDTTSIQIETLTSNNKINKLYEFDLTAVEPIIDNYSDNVHFGETLQYDKVFKYSTKDTILNNIDPFKPIKIKLQLYYLVGEQFVDVIIESNCIQKGINYQISAYCDNNISIPTSYPSGINYNFGVLIIPNRNTADNVYEHIVEFCSNEDFAFGDIEFCSKIELWQ